MKTNFYLIVVFIIATACISLQKATAQNTSPFWSLKGNNNTTNSSIFGTLNNTNLNFYTNNSQRMIINGINGEIGIGTINPSSRLHVNSTGSENPFKAAVNGTTKFLIHNDGGVSIGSGITPPVNGLFVSGFTGIGTANPNAKLHIFLGSAGLSGRPANVSLMLENSNHNYISMLAPAADETGILFGNAQSLVSGGIIYNNIATPSGLQFRINNNTTGMVLTSNGNLGVGTTTPNGYKTRIKLSAADFGFDIQNPTEDGDWEFFPSPDMQLYFNGTFVGSFDRGSGTYTAVSDERLKTNIRNMPAVLDEINQLKPSVYQFKNSTEKKDYNGFIAQDVLKIFPDLVLHNVNKQHNLDVYSLNYSGFGVIAIKGIQELEPMLEEQKKINDEQAATIQTLEERVTKLEALINKTSAQNISQSTISFKNASLEQNNPNPFNQSTVIRYHLPQGSTGQINIYNETGNLVKTFIADQTGAVDLKGADLKAGTYTYTLIVNSKTIDSKKMLVIK